MREHASLREKLSWLSKDEFTFGAHEIHAAQSVVRARAVVDKRGRSGRMVLDHKVPDYIDGFDVGNELDIKSIAAVRQARALDLIFCGKTDRFLASIQRVKVPSGLKSGDVRAALRLAVASFVANEANGRARLTRVRRVSDIAALLAAAVGGVLLLWAGWGRVVGSIAAMASHAVVLRVSDVISVILKRVEGAIRSSHAYFDQAVLVEMAMFAICSLLLFSDFDPVSGTRRTVIRLLAIGCGSVSIAKFAHLGDWISLGWPVSWHGRNPAKSALINLMMARHTLEHHSLRHTDPDKAMSSLRDAAESVDEARSGLARAMNRRRFLFFGWRSERSGWNGDELIALSRHIVADASRRSIKSSVARLDLITGLVAASAWSKLDNPTADMVETRGLRLRAEGISPRRALIGALPLVIVSALRAFGPPVRDAVGFSLLVLSICWLVGLLAEPRGRSIADGVSQAADIVSLLPK